jgi:anti-anti-sigma factor
MEQAMNQIRPSKRLTIGVVSTPGDPQLGTIINGVVEIIRRQQGRIINIAAPIDDVGIPLPASDYIDGWIIVHWPGGVPALVATGAKVVTVNLAIDDLPCPAVLPDNRGGTYALVSHLIGLGHRRIAFLGDMQHKDMRDRYAGYAAALADHQLDLEPALVLGMDDPDDMVACRMAFRQISAEGLACTAIFAGHDYNAQRLIQEALLHGYQVPGDLAVVGFDDIETAQYSVPPLTTVRQQFVEHGRVAARLLLKLLSGEQVAAQVTTVPTALVIRASCGSDTSGGSDPASPPPPHAAVSASDAWQQELDHNLTAALLHPLPVDSALSPDQLWPGVSRVGQALAQARAGLRKRIDDELDATWQAACQINPPLTNVLAILEQIEQAAKLIGQTSADPDAPQRLDDLVHQMRLRLLWQHQVHSNNAGSQTIHVAEVYQWAVTTLLDQGQEAERLGWVEHTNETWACFGRWEGSRRAADDRLRVVGAFARAPLQRAAIGQQFQVAGFPPLDELPEEVQQGEHLLKILPVRTASAYWGLLALCGPIEPRLYSPTLAQILGSVLDNQALSVERARQQDVLREAYERERALAETVRALGSPIIPIRRGVLLVPLVGAIDSARAQLIIERVLDSVSAQRVESVLLDLTGVPLVDSQVAGALIQTARATMLLGAEVCLVGIRPEIAQSIIGLGLDISMVRSFSSIEVALQSLHRSKSI